MMSEGGASVEMPKYRCHKEVWALQIAFLERRRLKPDQDDDGAYLLTPIDAGYAPLYVSREWVRKHQPRIGGYYVRYTDGYESFSPAQAFEEGYTRV